MNYSLKSTSLTIADIASVSSFDASHVQKVRRGKIQRSLGKVVVVYQSSPVIGESLIEWHIPLANSGEYGSLYSASLGQFGDSLAFVSPIWGNVSVAFLPGENGFKVQKLQQSETDTFGYQIDIQFVRLA